MSKVLIVAGILSLVHCGYSAAQYRSHLRLIGQEFDGFLPADIIFQALFSLFVSLFGIVQLCDGFKEIRALNELKSKTCETLENRPSFYTFNHRDTLPDKGLVEDDSSDHEEDSVSEKTEKIVKEKRDVEALEKFLFGSSYSDPNLLPDKLDDSLEPSNKKVKKEAWVDEDDLVPAEDGFVNAKKYPKKVTKETSYRSHLVDKFESIYGRPKWATKALNKNKDDSDDEDLDLLGTAGDILSKGKRLHKNNIEYSKCANLTASESLKGIVTSVQFHPYSNVALISSINGQTNLVQVDGDENRKLNSIVLENYNLNRARFTVDGEEIIMGSKAASGFFFSYDMHSGVSAKVPLIRGSQRFPLKDFFLSPDGKYLASCGNKGNFYLFTMNPKENVASFKLNYDVLGLCFSPDSSKLFASDEGAVYLYDIRQSRRCLHRFIDDGALKCRYLAVSPNSKYLATGDESGLLNVYNYEEVITNNAPKPLKSFSNLVHPITCLKFNHTSEMLAAASSYTDNAIKIAHFPSCTVFSNFPQANALFNRINEVDISPNSGFIAMANNKGKAYLYRLNHYADY